MEQVSLKPHQILSTLKSNSTLDLIPGLAVALTGENGVGKSTFFHALKTVANQNLKLKNNCSFLDQLPLQPLSHLRGIDYLNTIIEFCPQTVLTKNLKAFELIEQFSFHQHLEKRVVELSGGENQTLKILGTFLINGGFYFLDEPTHFLDINRRNTLENYLKSLLKQNKSLFMIEHDQLFLRNICNKFYCLTRSSFEISFFEEDKLKL
ncbi:MAG: ATP-binding cassette domain-containing protein [Bacteriovoracaceae bacterium]